MSNKRKSMKQIKEIIHLHEEGALKEKGITKALKMSRTSIRKYLLKAKQLGLAFEKIKGNISTEPSYEYYKVLESQRGKIKIELAGLKGLIFLLFV